MDNMCEYGDLPAGTVVSLVDQYTATKVEQVKLARPLPT